MLAGVQLALFGVVPNVILAALLSASLGVIVGIFNLVIISWFQAESPPSMIGRVMSLLMFASVGVMPISFAVSGMLVDANVLAMFTVAGAVVIAVCLYLFSVRAVRQVD